MTDHHVYHYKLPYLALPGKDTRNRNGTNNTNRAPRPLACSTLPTFLCVRFQIQGSPGPQALDLYTHPSLVDQVEGEDYKSVQRYSISKSLKLTSKSVPHIISLMTGCSASSLN